MNDQYKAAYKQNYAWWDAKGADLPKGLFTKFNESFKAWEKRRGFATETDFVGNPLEGNESKPDPVQKLRGRPLALKLALESKKRVLAAEAAKAAKKAIKKGLKDPRMDTKFSPDIVGKQYSSSNNAQRKIKEYIIKNHLIIPPDYVFGVNKIDWGKYEITGTRKQNDKKNKKIQSINEANSL
jgi:hypothetical protein